MNKYEGYIHATGSLMVKKIPEWSNSTDENSPFVLKHLGIKMLPSLNQAKRYFEQQKAAENMLILTTKEG